MALQRDMASRKSGHMSSAWRRAGCMAALHLRIRLVYGMSSGIGAACRRASCRIPGHKCHSSESMDGSLAFPGRTCRASRPDTGIPDRSALHRDKDERSWDAHSSVLDRKGSCTAEGRFRKVAEAPRRSCRSDMQSPQRWPPCMLNTDPCDRALGTCGCRISAVVRRSLCKCAPTQHQSR